MSPQFTARADLFLKYKTTHSSHSLWILYDLHCIENVLAKSKCACYPIRSWMQMNLVCGLGTIAWHNQVNLVNENDIAKPFQV